MIKGVKVGLRAIERSDLQLLKDWRNRQDFRRFFREYRELNSDNQEAWYDNIVVRSPNTIMFMIVSADHGEPLGCCGLCNINWVQRHAELSLYIGWNDMYIDHDGFAQEACELLFRYAFQELCLHRIWAEVYDIDEKKCELYLQLGLIQEGLMRDHYYYGGKWHSSRMMSLLETDFGKA